jgi:perosamine synthetase
MRRSMGSRTVTSGAPLRLAAPFFGPEVYAAIEDVLASGHLTLGPACAAFEEAIAAEVGRQHAVAVSSGTAALHLALAALDIGPGDEVILPDFTHPATGHVILHQRARPVLVDVDLATYNLHPGALEQAFTARTRLVIAADIFGLPADYPSIEPLVRERDIPLLCDAACSLGARVAALPAAQYGTAATFSFHPRKLLTTGEGGMIVTDDAAFSERLRRLRNHGLERGRGQPRFTEAGFNYRLSDVLAAMGVAQVPLLEKLVQRRNELAAELSEQLKGIPGIQLPCIPEGMRSTFQAYVALLDDGVNREAFIRALADDGIEATVGTYALHAQPSFRRACGTRQGDVPTSWALSRRTVALPLHPSLTSEDTAAIAAAVRGALGGRR